MKFGICQTAFDSSNAFQQHIDTFHANIGCAVLKCANCEGIYLNQSDLENHIAKSHLSISMFIECDSFQFKDKLFIKELAYIDIENCIPQSICVKVPHYITKIPKNDMEHDSECEYTKGVSYDNDTEDFSYSQLLNILSNLYERKKEKDPKTVVGFFGGERREFA